MTRIALSPNTYTMQSIRRFSTQTTPPTSNTIPDVKPNLPRSLGRTGALFGAGIGGSAGFTLGGIIAGLTALDKGYADTATLCTPPLSAAALAIIGAPIGYGAGFFAGKIIQKTPLPNLMSNAKAGIIRFIKKL